MSQTKRGATAVTGMIMVVLATALMVPAVVASLDSPQTITVTQAENERIVLTGAISTEAVAIEGGNNANANFTLIDESTGETTPTGTLSEGENITVQLNGQDITVEVNDVIGQTEVVVSYTYPTFIGFPENSAIFFEHLGLIIIVSSIMMIAGVLSVIGGEVKNVR